MAVFRVTIWSKTRPILKVKVMFRFGIIAFLFFSSFLHSQTLTVRLLDKSTGEVVPYASIQTGPLEGTMSNEEGVFSVQISELKEPVLKISSMGYSSLEIPIDHLGKDSKIIYLEPAVIQLNEVQLGGRIPEVNEIIDLARANIPLNYPNTRTNYEMFYREASGMHFNKLLFELEKDSDLSREALKKADMQLRQLGSELAKQDQRNFMDFAGLMSLDKDSTEIIDIEGIRQLVDPTQDLDMEKIQERAKALISSHLDSNTTYVLKSGIFKIEDSLNPKAEFSSSDSDSIAVKSLNDRLTSLSLAATWKPKTRLSQFLNSSLYRYQLQKATYFDGNYVYAVTFFPKSGKALYSGTLFIDTNTFGVLRVNYQYAEGRNGKKINLKLLLGVRFEENESSGIVIFRKDEYTNKFQPYLIQESYGNLIYLHRDLKFIANRPKSEKVKFDFIMDGRYSRSASIWLRPIQDIPKVTYPYKKVKVQKLNKFNAEKWQDYFGLEPVEEMKRFGIENK